MQLSHTRAFPQNDSAGQTGAVLSECQSGPEAPKNMATWVETDAVNSFYCFLGAYSQEKPGFVLLCLVVKNTIPAGGGGRQPDARSGTNSSAHRPSRRPAAPKEEARSSHPPPGGSRSGHLPLKDAAPCSRYQLLRIQQPRKQGDGTAQGLTPANLS